MSLAQATLMDARGGARERAMAAWTLAGSFGVVVAPLLVAASTLGGFGWREPIVLLALGTLALLAFVRSAPFTADRGPDAAIVLRRAFSALRRREVLGWLGLLEVTDLMLDVLHGFLALYLVDAAGASPAAGAAGVAVWSAAGLVGDAGLLVVLRHLDGLTYLRASAAAVAVVFPVFLLVPRFEAKLVPLAILGLLSSGWYAIPKARLYAALPDQSGTAMALGTVTGFAGGAFPLAIGAAAASFGISTALWIPLAAPLVVLAALARR